MRVSRKIMLLSGAVLLTSLLTVAGIKLIPRFSEEGRYELIRRPPVSSGPTSEIDLVLEFREHGIEIEMKEQSARDLTDLPPELQDLQREIEKGSHGGAKFRPVGDDQWYSLERE